MATYLQGITDYIPHIQPFHPDLNFYQHALETKESQYQAGHDKISNLYGTYLNSELLREPDKEKRDKFFSQIQNDIQKISTVDLSLEENVNAAYKVFDPIINDNNITQDMVWTKKFRAEKSKGDQFKNSPDEKLHSQYWDGGDRALNYMADEYSKADDQSALEFDSPKYTPFVNVTKKVMQAAKDMGVEIQSISHSGGYNITTTNGQQLTGPLRNYFISMISDDSGAQDMYRTQAYLNRKEWIGANKDKYQGNEDAAESAYLKERVDAINKAHTRPLKETQDTLNHLKAVAAAKQGQIEKQGVPSSQVKATGSAWDNMMNQIKANTKAHDVYTSTINTVKPDELQGLDKRALRMRVDNAVAGTLMTMDMSAAAQEYADLHKKVSESVNEYDLKAVENKYTRELEDLKLLHSTELATFKHQLDHSGSDGETTWSPIEGGPGSTAKTNLQVQTTEDILQSQSKQEKATGDYLTNLYNKEYGLYTSGDASQQTLAKAVLDNVFGGKSKGEGYLNPDYTLKYADFSQNKSRLKPGSFDNLDKVYARATQTVKSHADLKLLDHTDLSEFNQLEHNVKYESNVTAAIKETATKAHNNVYNVIKNQAIGKSSEDADLMANSFTPVEFAKKFSARHGNETDYIIGKKNLQKDAATAYNDLTKSYYETYNSNIPGLEVPATRPSGGTGIGSQAMTARFDAATTKRGDLVTLHSIKQDIDSPSTVALMGTPEAIKPGEDSPLSRPTNPEAKRVATFIVDEFLKGGWKATDQKRPVVQITHNEIAANDPGTQAITFKVDEETAQAHRGSKNKPGPTATMFDGDTFNPNITLYIPTDQAKNVMHSRTKFSDADYLLQNGKEIVLDQHKDYGGTLKISKDAQGLKATGTLGYTDNEGRVKQTPVSLIRSSTSDPEAFKNALTEVLMNATRANTQAITDILNAQKKVWSVDELKQLTEANAQ